MKYEPLPALAWLIPDAIHGLCAGGSPLMSQEKPMATGIPAASVIQNDRPNVPKRLPERDLHVGPKTVQRVENEQDQG